MLKNTFWNTAPKGSPHQQVKFATRDMMKFSNCEPDQKLRIDTTKFRTGRTHHTN